ncbi:hypothetical protein XF_0265 [Xylella fastidiosa 9a5c]|uniref:Uncharacterized protein n=1 Tax=Xylella fastidiosa (strain 9a5c) TaxID=160492 RepID=Q9PGN3_XYLFA|nr:hypothetical protein XF_0265 [Xylella fastidiosa 9a5c]
MLIANTFYFIAVYCPQPSMIQKTFGCRIPAGNNDVLMSLLKHVIRMEFAACLGGAFQKKHYYYACCLLFICNA